MNTKEFDQLLKDYEKDILNDWHKAMGDKNIGFKDTLSYVGGCAERICRAIYLRNHKKEADKSISFANLTSTFNREKILDDLIKFHMDTVRKPRNIAVHVSRRYTKTFVDLMRNHLKEIMIWYKSYSGAKLYGLNLKQYDGRLRKKTATTIFRNFNKKNTVNEKLYEEVITNDRIMTLEPEEKMITDEPIFSCLIIDESGSMRSEKDKVLESHKEALSAIRGSMVCKKELLYLTQHTFNYQSKLLNTLSIVNSDGNDKIVELQSDNYVPFGTTALYDTLYEAITLLQIESDSFKAERFRNPQIIIAVLTDGEDTSSRKSANYVKELMEDLYKKGFVKSSVVIGWKDDGINEQQLENLRESIGFQKYISLEKSDPSAIREAFSLWSQLNVS